MRYAIDLAGVTALVSSVAVATEDVPALVADTLGAVDDAAAALRVDAAEVAAALDAVFATRRQSGPGMPLRTTALLLAVQESTTAYVTGDAQMANDTSTAAGSAVGSTSVVQPRGFGPRPVR